MITNVMSKSIMTSCIRRCTTGSVGGSSNIHRISSYSLEQNANLISSLPVRTFGSVAPGSDPLDVIRKECINRNLCDEHGHRRPGTHWVFSIAITPDDPSKPPNLRTVGVQRVSELGIDFVMKKGSVTCDSLAEGRPISILHLQGRYIPGEKAEQWRGEGICKRLPLDDYILNALPHYTITSMVASKRVEKEKIAIEEETEYIKESRNAGIVSSGDRLVLSDKLHATDVMQKTRIELTNGDIPHDEIDASIRAFRFYPSRLECMTGGPDSAMWERWEWLKDPDTDNAWYDPKPLLPH